MPFDKNHMLHWSEGTAKNLAKNKNKVGAYSLLAKKLSKPYVTPELRKAFEKMSKEEQDVLKSMAGWISGAQFEGQWRRVANLIDRDLVTIDIDYVRASFPDEMKMGLLKISQWAFIAHSSRRHTEDNPRIRIFIPLSRKVDQDEYQAIVRYIAWLIDPEMKVVDMVSFRPGQMMFLPTCSKDDAKIYFFHDNAAEFPSSELLDVDEVFAAVSAQFGNYRDMASLPRSPEEADHREKVAKAEHPLEKQGPVGDFNRAYPDIEVAMEVFLPGVYTPGDYHSGNPRYTYAGSTSSNGAVIYDGMFLYSHHGHDPVCNMNVNAFDLVRIHKFGAQDEGKEIKGPTSAPSYKAMLSMLETDRKYLKAAKDRKFGGVERFTEIEEDGVVDEEAEEVEEANDPLDAFADIEPEPDPAASRPRPSSSKSPRDSEIDAEIERLVGSAFSKATSSAKADKENKRRVAGRVFPEPPKDWFSEQIEINAVSKEIVCSLTNIVKLLSWDKRTKHKIGFNLFTQKVVVIGDIDTRIPGINKVSCQDPVNGDPWQDWMEGVLMCMLEGENGSESGAVGYGMKIGIGDLRMAIEAVARTNGFHPIREWLEALVWDGQRRLHTFLQRYLGEADNDYVRETAEILLVGACYRAMTPGLKFDYIPIIEGKQGSRKSTFVRVLASDQWFGELHVELSDERKVAEHIAGKWFGELPEMVSANKTEVNALKQFARRTTDDVRLAYGKNVSILPRQAVFIGTTNDAKILRDPTGNRTFLMLKATLEKIDTEGLEAERPQLFAEAMHLLGLMRQKKPYGELPFQFKTQAAKDEAVTRQQGARNFTVGERLATEIRDYFNEPRSLRAWLHEIEAPVELLAVYDERFGEDRVNEMMVVPTVFREKDMRRLVLHGKAMSLNIPTDGTVQNTLETLEGWGRTGPDKWRFGSQRSTPRGLRGAWFFRKGCSGEEEMQGFKIWEPSEDEDDEINIGDLI